MALLRQPGPRKRTTWRRNSASPETAYDPGMKTDDDRPRTADGEPAVGIGALRRFVEIVKVDGLRIHRVARRRFTTRGVERSGRNDLRYARRPMRVRSFQGLKSGPPGRAVRADPILSGWISSSSGRQRALPRLRPRTPVAVLSWCGHARQRCAAVRRPMFLKPHRERVLQHGRIDGIWAATALQGDLVGRGGRSGGDVRWVGCGDGWWSRSPTPRRSGGEIAVRPQQRSPRGTWTDVTGIGGRPCPREQEGPEHGRSGLRG